MQKTKTHIKSVNEKWIVLAKQHRSGIWSTFAAYVLDNLVPAVALFEISLKKVHVLLLRFIYI